MYSKLLCSMVVTVIGIGFVGADEFGATITKVDGDKITYQKFKKIKGKAPEKDGDAVVINAKGAKVTFGTYNKDTKKFDATDAIEGGLKNDMFAKIGEKGVNARLTTEGEGKDAKVTQVGITKKKKAAE